MFSDELMEYNRLYVDIWKIFKRFSEPSDSEDFWLELIRESEEIYGRYNKSDLAKNLLIATMNEIEKIWKEKTNGRK